MEPLEQGKESSVETNEMWKLSGGRVATLENAKTAVEMGVDFDCANRGEIRELGSQMRRLQISSFARRQELILFCFRRLEQCRGLRWNM